jgi:hypothetical protein
VCARLSPTWRRSPLAPVLPSPTQVPNFLVEFITPIIKATKGNQRLVFHTMPECVTCASCVLSNTILPAAHTRCTLPSILSGMRRGRSPTARQAPRAGRSSTIRREYRAHSVRV